MSIACQWFGVSGIRHSGWVGLDHALSYNACIPKGRQLLSKIQYHRFSRKIVVTGVLGHAESKFGLYFVLWAIIPVYRLVVNLNSVQYTDSYAFNIAGIKKLNNFLFELPDSVWANLASLILVLPGQDPSYIFVFQHTTINSSISLNIMW